MRPIASNHRCKSGGALEAHFGLGKHAKVNITVTLLTGNLNLLGSHNVGCLNLSASHDSARITPAATKAAMIEPTAAPIEFTPSAIAVIFSSKCEK